MDKRKAIEDSDKRGAEVIKKQIAFVEKEREREHELIFIDGAASIIFLIMIILLIVFKSSILVHEFIFWLGLICAFFLTGFFAYLSGSHIFKERDKKIVIEKLKGETERL